jgi:membrane protease YdiL (CAAX protease family)
MTRILAMRILALLDIIALPCATMWIIWREPPKLSHAWILLPIWLIASFAIHRDTTRTLGMRAENLWRAFLRASLVLGPMAAGLILIGFARGVRIPNSPGTFAPHHFWNYFAFCLLQQVALNSLFSNRSFFLTKRIPAAALISAIIFAILHWPNPVLMPATFIAGFAMAWLFLRERNILPLALWHMILGILIGWAMPIAWHHALRVGPGYYTFH